MSTVTREASDCAVNDLSDLLLVVRRTDTYVSVSPTAIGSSENAPFGIVRGSHEGEGWWGSNLLGLEPAVELLCGIARQPEAVARLCERICAAALVR